MDLLVSIIFFILGIIIGSFLNVVIYRLNTRRTLGGRSACMSCQHKLSWYELIPIFSFLGLGGRCRNCKSKISIQYPLVEIFSGLIFASLFFKFKELLTSDPQVFAVTFIYYALCFSIFLVIAVYDLKHKIIPDSLALSLGILAFAGLFLFNNSVFSPHLPIPTEFFSGIFIALPFALCWLLSLGRWMGLGDAKLAISIGWLLGIQVALSGLVVAFWSGAIVGVALIFFSKIAKIKKVGMKTEIPFGPFLALGAFLAFIFVWNFFGI